MVRPSQSPLSDSAERRETSRAQNTQEHSERRVHHFKAEERRGYPAVQSRILPPQAPTSEEVAQRMLSNARATPIKRFDSADFFLEQQKHKRALPPVAAPADSSAAQAVTSDAVVQAELLERPPPLSFAPPLQCVAPCGSPVLRSRRS